MKRLAIVGAGITGLTAASELAAAGHAVTVFEATGRVGGAIRTVLRDGWLVEAGPNTALLRDTSLDPMIERAGLGAELQIANPAAAKRFIVRHGRPNALPQSLWGALTTPVFNFRGKLRVLAEPFIRQNRDNPDETLAAFARRRVGQEFLDYAVNPFIGGVYACAPEELCVRHALPRLWRLEQNHGSLVRGTIALMRAKRKSGVRTKTRLVSFAGGLATLPRALAAALGDAVRLGTAVTGVARVATGWRLTFHPAGSVAGAAAADTADFDAVLFTCGSAALARLDIAGRQPLAALSTLPWSSVTSLALGFRREDVAHPLDGFGMLVPAKENRRILGALFSSTLFPGRAPAGHVLLTVFVGGRQPEYAALPDAELDTLVLAELRELIGTQGDPVFRHCSRVPLAIPKYTAAFGALSAAMDAFEHDHPGLFIAGNCRTGISLADCMAAGLAVAWLIFNYGTPVPDAAQWRAGIPALAPAWAEGNVVLGPTATPHGMPLLARAVLGVLVHANHQWDDRVTTVVNALLLVATCALLLAACARRLGWTALWASALCGGILLALPVGGEQSLAGSALPDRLGLLLAFPAAWALLDRNLTSPFWWFAALSLLLAQAAADWTVAVCAALGVVAAIRVLTSNTRRPRDLAVLGLVVVGLVANWLLNPGGLSALSWSSLRGMTAALGDPWPVLSLALLVPLGIRLVAGARDGDRKHSLAPFAAAALAGCATIGWLLAEPAPRAWGSPAAALDILLLLLLLGFAALTQLWHFRWQSLPIRIGLTCLWSAVLLLGLQYRLDAAVGHELPAAAERHARELTALAQHLGTAPVETEAADAASPPDIGYALPHLASPALRAVLPFVLQTPIALRGGPATTADFSPLHRDRFALPTPEEPAWAGGPAAQADGGTVFISLPLPAAKTRVLRFRTAGDLGTARFPFALRSTRTGELVALELETTTGERWRTANLLRPDDPVVIVAGPAALGTWGAFTCPVEMGLWSWATAKLAKNWAWVLAAGGLALAGALLLPLAPRLPRRDTVAIDEFGRLHVSRRHPAP